MKNIEEMEKPLRNINPNILFNENLKFLMTPYSGTRYGFSGGYSGSTFTNRAIFIEESKNINPEVCQILMNSINPGTRLMGIEYYMKNKSDFKNQDLINNWRVLIGLLGLIFIGLVIVPQFAVFGLVGGFGLVLAALWRQRELSSAWLRAVPRATSTTSAPLGEPSSPPVMLRITP